MNNAQISSNLTLCTLLCLNLCILSECLKHFCFNPCTADCYLLQIQQYNFAGLPQKPKIEGGAAIKAEAGDPNGSILPATGQKEVVMQWHDVDIVRGTQYTVTGYQIPVEGDKVGEGEGRWVQGNIVQPSSVAGWRTEDGES